MSNILSKKVLDKKDKILSKKVIDNNPKTEIVPKISNIIFFVNGHYSWIFPGPSKGGKKYWDYFDTHFFNATAKYFRLNSEDCKDEYVDGSTFIAIDASGGERVNKGYSFAYKYFNENKHVIKGKKIYFVSHSEGCAFAVGMAQYFEEQKQNVVELVLLSCDESDEFKINLRAKSYQVEYMYWDKSFPDGNCEPEFDWVINTDKTSGGVSGISKFGIIIRNTLAFNTVHGSTVNSRIFDSIADLKSVIVSDNWNADGDIFSSQSKVPNGTKFYMVGTRVISTNHPQWNEKTLKIDYSLPCKPK